MTAAPLDRAELGAARRLSRAAALAAAGAISLALTLDPYVLRGASMAGAHEGLPLLMLGVSSAFAYGLGFRTASQPIRILTHPAATWMMLGVGAALIFAR
jgi:predicted membrane protein